MHNPTKPNYLLILPGIGMVLFALIYMFTTSAMIVAFKESLDEDRLSVFVTYTSFAFILFMFYMNIYVVVLNYLFYKKSHLFKYCYTFYSLATILLVSLFAWSLQYISFTINDIEIHNFNWYLIILIMFCVSISLVSYFYRSNDIKQRFHYRDTNILRFIVITKLIFIFVIGVYWNWEYIGGNGTLVQHNSEVGTSLQTKIDQRIQELENDKK